MFLKKSVHVFSLLLNPIINKELINFLQEQMACLRTASFTYDPKTFSIVDKVAKIVKKEETEFSVLSLNPLHTL